MISECSNVNIDTCTTNNNYYGLWISNAQCDANKTNMKYNTNHGVKMYICVTGISPSNFEWCIVEDNDQHGMYICENENLNGLITIKNTKIWKNEIAGLYCTGSNTNPVLDHSKVKDNLVGVQAVYGAKPTLGQFFMGGNNSIYDHESYNVYGSPNSELLTSGK